MVQPDSRLKSKKPPSLVIAIPPPEQTMPRPPGQVGFSRAQIDLILPDSPGTTSKVCRLV